MSKISSRGFEVAHKIRDREPFQTYGALCARKVNGLSVWDSGQLSGPDLDTFRADCSHILYVVYSYSTPIAWWTGTVRGWYVVKQKFSRTTSTHQGKLYLIPRQMDVPGWDTEAGYPLDQCKHWGTPGSDCAGPRVGVTPDGLVYCEHHFNQIGA